MDIQNTIDYLREQKAKVEVVIAALEELQHASNSGNTPRLRGSRRGRTSMGAQERQQVSERMRRYWANRRQQKITKQHTHDA